MDRVASRSLAFAAAALIAFSSPSFGAEPKAKTKQDPRKTESPRKKNQHSLGEVEILGSAEHPQALFFLPRAAFHLLPLQGNDEEKITILKDDKVMGEKP